MGATPLFEDLPEIPAAVPKTAPVERKAMRVLEPNRGQVELRPSDLESLLPEGHRARLVWDFVGGQNLDRRYAGIKAVEGGVGRAAISPAILYALWLFATLEGIGGARKLARLTQEHDAYRWICGGVQVTPHPIGLSQSKHCPTRRPCITSSAQRKSRR